VTQLAFVVGLGDGAEVVTRGVTASAGRDGIARVTLGATKDKQAKNERTNAGKRREKTAWLALGRAPTEDCSDFRHRCQFLPKEGRW
jgi:hypothetical protein